MQVLILQVPDARTMKLDRLLAEDRADALRAQLVVAVDGRRIKVLKDNSGDESLAELVVYRANGQKVTPVGPGSA